MTKITMTTIPSPYEFQKYPTESIAKIQSGTKINFWEHTISILGPDASLIFRRYEVKRFEAEAV